MNKIEYRLPSIIAFYCLLLIGIAAGANAATLSLSQQPVTLKPVSASDISQRADAANRVALGQAKGTINPSGAVSMSTALSSLPIRTIFNLTVDTLWRLQFDDGEWVGPVTVEVNYTVIDNNGMLGSLSSLSAPASQIAVTGALHQLKERRRSNGSLRDLTGGAQFTIDIRRAVSDGPHSGTLVVEVNLI